MVEKLVEHILLMPREPSVQFLFVGVFECTAHTVLTDDQSESQQCCEHRIVAQPVDVNIPGEATDYRKNCRVYDIANFRGVWACIVERYILNEPVEKPARLQIGHKVSDPATLRDLRFEGSSLCLVSRQMQGCQKFVQAQTPLIVYNLERNDLLKHRNHRHRSLQTDDSCSID